MRDTDAMEKFKDSNGVFVCKTSNYNNYNIEVASEPRNKSLFLYIDFCS